MLAIDDDVRRDDTMFESMGGVHTGMIKNDRASNLDRMFHVYIGSDDAILYCYIRTHKSIRYAPNIR